MKDFRDAPVRSLNEFSPRARRGILAVLWIAALLLFSAPAMAATYTVTNTNDSGSGSLRQAIIDANGDSASDTIVFDSGVDAQAITLTSGEIAISEAVVITGNGVSSTIIDGAGNGDNRIFNVSATGQVTISKLTLRNASLTSVEEGGAIYSSHASGELWLDEVVLSGNSIVVATNSTLSGGAIYATGGGDLRLTDCTFSNNKVENSNNKNAYGGAVFFGGAGSLTISGCTFSDNSAVSSISSHGGALKTQVNSTTTISDSTFYNNEGRVGGAINLAGSSATLKSCTITENTAEFGGGIRSQQGTNTLYGCIIYGNTATTSGPDINETFAVADYNLIGDTSDATLTSESNNIVGQDPLLEEAADNGGETETMTLGDGSPALDAIPSGTCYTSTDQRGISRPQFGSCDMGAIELAYILTVSTSGDGSGAVTDNTSAISCGGSCQAPYDEGTSLTLTATPDSGSTFSGWSGACSGAGDCSVTMDETKSVTATFEIADTTHVVPALGGWGILAFGFGLLMLSLFKKRR